MNDFLKWMLFAGGSFLAVFEPIEALMYVVSMLFALDLVTGVLSSVRRKEKIESGKLRWSFYKLLVYLGTMALTFAVCEKMGLSPETAANAVKVEAWFVVYIEGLSIVENLQKIKDNVYLQFLHYLLAVEFLKKFTIMSDFFKINKNENQS